MEIKFCDFVDATGRNVVGDWFGTLPEQVREEVRAEFDSRFGYLSILPSGQWKRPYTDRLHGPYRELREFRVKVDRMQFRLFGVDGPAIGQVTLVGGARETGDRFEPRSALDIALRRVRQLENGDGGTVLHG